MRLCATVNFHIPITTLTPIVRSANLNSHSFQSRDVGGRFRQRSARECIASSWRAESVLSFRQNTIRHPVQSLCDEIYFSLVYYLTTRTHTIVVIAYPRRWSKSGNICIDICMNHENDVGAKDGCGQRSTNFSILIC